MAASSTGSASLIGVMRHVAAFDAADPEHKPEKADSPIASLDGAKDALQVGRGLGEALRDEMQTTVPPATRWSVRVVHAETDITRRTAELVKQSIESESEFLRVAMTGNMMLRTRVAGDADAVATDVTKMRDAVSEASKHGDVVVVVGHDPSMSWLVHDLVRHEDRRSLLTALKAVLSAEHARCWLHAPSSLPLRRGEVTA